MARNNRRTNDEILQALKDNDGFVCHAARDLEIDPSTIHRRIKNTKKLRDAYRAMNRYNVEASEKKLLENIKKGDTTAIIFHLKCKGGWREKQEVQVKHKGKVHIRVKLPDDMEEE